MLKTLRSAFLILALTLAHSSPLAFAKGGNGGEYGGGELSGVAIPASDDRVISEEQASKAISVCLIEGDPQRGLVPALAPLYEALYGGDVRDLSGTTRESVSDYSKAKYKRPGLPSSITFYDQAKVSEIERSTIYADPQRKELVIGLGRMWNKKLMKQVLKGEVIYRNDKALSKTEPSSGNYGTIEVDGYSGQDENLRVNQPIEMQFHLGGNSLDNEALLNRDRVLSRKTTLPAVRYETRQPSKDGDPAKTVLHGVYIETFGKRMGPSALYAYNENYGIVTRTHPIASFDTQAYADCLQSELNRRSLRNEKSAR